MLYNTFFNNDIELNKCICDTTNEYKDFFEVKKNFRVDVFLMSKNDFDEYKDKKDDYAVALACTENNIVIACQQKDIGNLYNKEEYKKLITHEIAHVFAFRYVDFNKFIPLWLQEGIAVYLSNQLREDDKCQNIEKLFNEDVDAHISYLGGGLFVKYLIENYGKEKFLEFYGSLKDIKSKDETYKSFEIIYKKSARDLLTTFATNFLSTHTLMQ